MADPVIWDELAALFPLDEHTVATLDERRRQVRPHIERTVLPDLHKKGVEVLVRRPGPPILLAAEQPEEPALREVVDWDEAFFPVEDDLAPLGEPLRGVEDDLASLAAALERQPPRVTHQGSWDKQTTKQIGRRLLDKELARSGVWHTADKRWQRALAVLQVMHLVPMDPVTRQLEVSHGVPTLLHGTRAERFDHLVRQVVDADLHPVLPVYREVLQQADQQAVDEVIFRELLVEHHKLLLLQSLGGSDEEVHGPLLSYVRDVLSRLGLLAVGPGAFAATPDGRAWAGLEPPLAPARMLVTSDLEIVLPPESLEPYERYHLERFTTCLQRDVANRHRLTRKDLAAWLTHGSVQDILTLLEAHAWGVPINVGEALNAWAQDLTRVVLHIDD